MTTISVSELASFSSAVSPDKGSSAAKGVGISGSYIAAALQFNNQGRLWTIEGSPATATLAQQTFQMLGLSERVTSLVGPFYNVSAPCLKEKNRLT